MEEDKLIRERKEKIIKFLKKDMVVSGFLIVGVIAFLLGLVNLVGFNYIFNSTQWFWLGGASIISGVIYNNKKIRALTFVPLVAWVAWISVFIRTRNLSGLRDITTGGWTLGPDLDPFLFMRWAKYIVEHGTLYAIDHMRYVPLGYNTKVELVFLPYLIAWFHNIAVEFGSTSIQHSAALFPVFMFVLTVGAFFLFVRKLFVKELGNISASVIAIISSFFLSVMPSLLPRTIAGIPEKESAAFFFMFMAFYLFLSAWHSEKKYGKYIFALLSGAFTAGMALVWGGYIYLFVIIGGSVFVSFILGSVNKERLISYSIWILFSFIMMDLFSDRYVIKEIVGSTTTGVALFVFVLLIIDKAISNKKIKKYFEGERFSKIPQPLISCGVAFLVAAIAASVLFGPGFLLNVGQGVFDNFVKPIQDRVGITVAENRQPYFSEWANSFGPIVGNAPVLFWLFVTGSIFLFYNLLTPLKMKEKIVITVAYFVFLCAITFSRISPNHTFNGENFISILFYIGGMLFFACVLIYYYYGYYKKGEIEKLKSINFGLILLFVFFALAIVSARGAVRLIMILAIPGPIMISYLLVFLGRKSFVKKDNLNIFYIGGAIIVFLLVLFSANIYYNGVTSTASGYVPSQYNQQWQKSMSWVRESTPENSVFAHWWDYGYWVQSLGERATVLDGGNAISYWNHMMGRHGITGLEEKPALEFFYAHNVTHFLIDSSDIGKYTAFSSIGSDVNYDRRSWVPTLTRQADQTFETKNDIANIYLGGTQLDEDIVYTINGTETFLPGLGGRDINSPQSLAGLGGVRIDYNKNTTEISSITGIYVYNNQQYLIPIRYAFYKGELVDLGEGIEVGVLIMPSLEQSSNGVQMDNVGAILYLSRRTFNSQLAELYLFGKETNYFKLAHSEDDFIVESLKSQGLAIGDFVYFGGFRGPIKIWDVSYPNNIEFKEEFISTDYPEELRAV